MRTIQAAALTDAVAKLCIQANTHLPEDIVSALDATRQNEPWPLAKETLGLLWENMELAEEKNLPVCQDTGYAVVLAEIGQNVHIEGAPLADAVNSGVRRAYEDFRFRKSVCDPLTRVNTTDNTPAAMHTEIVAGEKVRLTFLPKGFGSENMSRLYMLTPSQGVQGVIDSIVETVRLAGSRPCPPVVCGVGIGGTFDTCAYLAKKALTRELGTHNPRADVAAIEREALAKINALGIGPQGFGGKVTALGVLCEVAPTHIAGLPVAVNIQCHCMRCARCEL